MLHQFFVAPHSSPLLCLHILLDTYDLYTDDDFVLDYTNAPWCCERMIVCDVSVVYIPHFVRNAQHIDYDLCVYVLIGKSHGT